MIQRTRALKRPRGHGGDQLEQGLLQLMGSVPIVCWPFSESPTRVQSALISLPSLAGRQGTLSRNAIYGPGFGVLDASIQKNIFLNEKHRLQFRVEFFNFTNHTNFGSVQRNIRSGQFGRITSTRPGRETQLSLRYDF